jgi:hypothetical protein
LLGGRRSVYFIAGGLQFQLDDTPKFIFVLYD